MPANYSLIKCNRKATTNGGKKVKRGGGVAFVLDNRFPYKPITTKTYNSFEHIAITVTFHRDCLNLVTIYRPPNLSIPQFFEEFQSLVAFLHSRSTNFIITGDFNIHVDKISDPKTQSFNNILSILNLKQHVSFSTHSSGHTLDLLITQMIALMLPPFPLLISSVTTVH